jgi:hypothetical protein
MRLIHAAFPLMLAILAGPSLGAKDVQFGVQGGLALPMGDLSDTGSLGLGFGGHGRYDLGSGHGLMGRVDFTFYGQKSGVSTRDLGIAMDYTYHLDRHRRGVYLLAGVSLQDYTFSRSGYSNSRNGLGVDLGIGLDVDRNLGFQARVTTHNIDSATFTALNLGVTYTF